MKRRLTWFLLMAIIGLGAYASTLQATDPNAGYSSSPLGAARFDEIDVSNFTLPANFWQSRQKTQGLSDVYVQSNVWQPGGSTGWHTHPGHSLILVIAGTVTAYESDDPACAPHTYPVGAGFVDPGGGHAHVLRNEGSIEARTIAVQLIPAAAMRRISSPHPAGCPISVQ